MGLMEGSGGNGDIAGGGVDCASDSVFDLLVTGAFARLLSGPVPPRLGLPWPTVDMRRKKLGLTANTSSEGADGALPSAFATGAVAVNKNAGNCTG